MPKRILFHLTVHIRNSHVSSSRDTRSMIFSSFPFYRPHSIIPMLRGDHVCAREALLRLLNFEYLLLRVHFICPMAAATGDNQTNTRSAHAARSLHSK